MNLESRIVLEPDVTCQTLNKFGNGSTYFPKCNIFTIQLEYKKNKEIDFTLNGFIMYTSICFQFCFPCQAILN